MNIYNFILTLPFFLIHINSDANTNPIRVLLITGGTLIKYNKIMVPTSLYSVLNDNENIVWDHASLDEAAFENNINDEYDVLIFFNRSDSLSEKATKNLIKFIESGKGIVVLHSGLSSYNNWEWWWRDVVGGKYQYLVDEKVPKSGYAQDVLYPLIPKRDHQLTNAVGSIKLKDELYNKLVFSPDIISLYSSNHPESDGPLVWIGPHKKSRIISIVPGHYNSTYCDKGFQSLLNHSIYWAGKKESLIKVYNKKESTEMQNEIDAVKSVIEKAYIEGIHTTQDEQTVRSGFHPDFEMLVLKEDNLVKVNLTDWFKRIEQLKQENQELWTKETTYSNIEVSIEGNSASVRFKVFKDKDYFSTDFMLLYKFTDGWKIVSKIFTF